MKANSKTKKGKQAVVFIHGQGEQVPMETLTEFVDSVWVTDPSVYGSTPYADDLKLNDVWGKPDNRNRSHELRRITTRQAMNGYRTDFFSFYWADLMGGNTWQHFTGWLAGLLLRWPSRVPKNVRPVWCLLWVISISILAVIINQFVPLFEKLGVGSIEYFPIAWLNGLSDLKKGLISLGFSATGYLAMRKLTLYFGDAARYTTPKPFNIARRQEIRERGVHLLKRLMGVDDWDQAKLLAYLDEHGKMPEWQSDYDKIIIVCHSLGTIIGYDILRQTFADVAKMSMPVKIDGKATKAQPTKRRALEKHLTKATNGRDTYDLGIYQQKQDACYEELRALGNPWIVSDFVTLGAPLTHAEFLMAYDMEDLRYHQEQRIFPTCPPMLEFDINTGAGRFSYKNTVKTAGLKKMEFDHLHHAAHFAFTRWTNVYSQAKAIFFGDVISGPLADHFDYAPRDGLKTNLEGIRDVRVMPTKLAAFKGDNAPFFTHNNYWKWREKKQWTKRNPIHPGKAPDHIRILRHILRLTRD